MTATELRTQPSRWVAESVDHDPAKITQARRTAGLTKRETARRIGVAESLICEIEKGTRNATPPNLKKLAELFDCPVESLQRENA